MKVGQPETPLACLPFSYSRASTTSARSREAQYLGAPQGTATFILRARPPTSLGNDRQQLEGHHSWASADCQGKAQGSSVVSGNYLTFPGFS